MSIRTHIPGLLAFWLLMVLFAPPALSSELTLEDCSKCHLIQQKTLLASGGKHASAVTCVDCHPHHLPTDKTTRLDCASCHTDRPHYQLDNCQHCHLDPHQPLMSLRDPLKPAKKECLSCHAEVGQQMAAEPSRHAKLFCNRCHEKHRQIPACLDCHQPHQQSQSADVCQQCHPAHQPLLVAPSGRLPANACRPCHVEEANDLASTTTLHGGINCLYCHKGRHPSTPQCQDCHGLPHTQAIHGKYRDCLECHGDAHNLQ
ncbi:hypothetical protein SAMN02745165_01923 [Malonomonas rubra DSM 5091]|uniref:Uncharacterized protein n=1 Tax=Malonomonas rubra DSM 5091 TaxID=1122189 RepID=A0A1M6HY38_MALRU|nr:cytochrome c3 family protein [Malonomonas rubra]SHJ27115.1 hypothetical protein SAMN02745165_01923 [Malonomonas rubra DSM 5091]